MVVIVDVGTGNLRSLGNALGVLGVSYRVASEPPRECPGLFLLPGVGAFGHASRALGAGGWSGYLKEAVAAGSSVVGICLGLQLLFEASEESPGAPGLGLLGGRVRRLEAGEAKVPHIGWAQLRFSEGEPAGPRPKWAYFVHSYAVRPADTSAVTAWADHGGRPFPAVVRKGRVVGVQFHPEKSQGEGLSYLAALVGGAA